MPLAIAIEMVQTMSLIHDDLPCMDDDDLHRGKPSNLHVLGKPIDILIDDAFLTLAFDHLIDPTSYLADDLIPPAHIICMVAKLSRSIELEGLVIGEMVDIESTGLAIPFGLDRLKFIHLHKSAYLVEVSVVIGANIGGGSND